MPDKTVVDQATADIPEEKFVTVEVISDTPVDRVYKGDTLSLSEAIAEQFVKLKLVKIVSDAGAASAASTSTPPTAATTIQKP